MTQEIKGMTVQEFRYWLEGVEEMQPEGWSPDTRQWKRIREKLYTIVETVQQPTKLYRVPEPNYEETPYQGPIQLAPPGLSRHIQAPPSNNALFANADNPTNPVKTPNLDTSNGTYEPAFI